MHATASKLKMFGAVAQVRVGVSLLKFEAMSYFRMCLFFCFAKHFDKSMGVRFFFALDMHALYAVCAGCLKVFLRV